MTQSGLAPSLVAAATGLGILLGGSGAAQAASFNLAQNGTQSQSMSFNQFNTALGTLDQVVVELSGVSVGGGSTLSILGAEGGSFGTTGFSADLKILDPGSNALFSGAYQDSATCTVPGVSVGNCSGGVNPPTANGTPFQPNPTNPVDNSPFQGVGLVNLLAAIQNFNATNSCTYETNGGPPITRECDSPLSNNILWSGTVTVAYLYTPVGGGDAQRIESGDVPGAVGEVPEPASLALLGFGLAGLGWARRRRA